MKDKVNLINKCLAEWNPIGVPIDIAQSEYTSYIPDIITYFGKYGDVYSYLTYIYSEILEYDVNSKSELATMGVSKRINGILKT